MTTPLPPTPPLSRAKLGVVERTLLYGDSMPIQRVERQSAWGLHFADGVYNEGEWFVDLPNIPSYASLLRKLNPAFVGLMGGAQYDQAHQRAEWIQANLPQTRIIWRHYKHAPPGGTEPKDDGMWKLPAREWVDNIGLAHGYHQRGWYVVTDNEPAMEDWTPYVNWLIDLLDYGIPKGLRFAVLRFSTHNPTLESIASGVFDRAFHAIAHHQGSADDRRIVLSPNWYFSRTNTDGIRHVIALKQRFQAVTGVEPSIVLGEYAYAHDLDPYTGWLAAGLGAADMLNMLKLNFETLAAPHGIHALPYCVGTIGGPQVTTFHLSRSTLDKLTLVAPPVTAPRPPVVTPPPAPAPPPAPEPPVDEDDTTEAPPVNEPQLDAALRKAITEAVNEAIDRKLGPLLHILALLMTGYASDRKNQALMMETVMNELRKEVETQFPEVQLKESA